MDYKKKTVECIGIRVCFSVPSWEADLQRNPAQDTLSLCKTPKVGLLLRSDESIQLGTKTLLTLIQCVQSCWKWMKQNVIAQAFFFLQHTECSGNLTYCLVNNFTYVHLQLLLFFLTYKQIPAFPFLFTSFPEEYQICYSP